jgi:hypothetical protein
MSEHALFEYKAKLINTPHIEERGELIHCSIKMEVGLQDGRSQVICLRKCGQAVV